MARAQDWGVCGASLERAQYSKRPKLLVRVCTIRSVDKKETPGYAVPKGWRPRAVGQVSRAETEVDDTGAETQHVRRVQGRRDRGDHDESVLEQISTYFLIVSMSCVSMSCFSYSRIGLTSISPYTHSAPPRKRGSERERARVRILRRFECARDDLRRLAGPRLVSNVDLDRGPRLGSTLDGRRGMCEG